MKFDMVFVSNTGRQQRPFFDPSSRYRAFALAEHFRREGKRVTFLSQAAFEAETDSFTDAPLILFHRPGATETMMRYVTRNRARQTLIADYDDLVFDVTAAAITPAVRDRGEDVTRVSRSLAGNAEIGAMFRHRTASTVPLAEKATEILGGPTQVIHNALDPIYLGVAQVLARDLARRQPVFDLGYFSGTASHNRDFEMIAGVLADYLRENPARKFLLFGPVAMPEPLLAVEHQIVRRSVVSFYEMAAEITQCRMVLGPLVDSVFARCKSGLKFFEAGVLGTAVAATPIPDIDRFESPLLHKCVTSDDWAAAIRAPAIPEADVRAAIARVADEAGFDRQVAAWREAFLGQSA
jgi:hypothetical protein